MDQFTIGEVAQRVGVNASTLRYYERIGLLEKPARVSGQRRYTPEVLARLALIRMAQEAGFSIEEIRTLLSGFPAETPPAERWQELAERKLQEVDAMIRRMETVRQVLRESMACDCLTLDACAHDGWRTTRNERAEKRKAGEMFTWMHR